MRWERDMQIEDLRDHPTELIVRAVRFIGQWRAGNSRSETS